VTKITSTSDYVSNDNDQSVVEICITRVISALRDTKSMESHVDAVVALLESCLNHNLRPTAQHDDPPHAKIPDDHISSLFLVSSLMSYMVVEGTRMAAAIRFHPGYTL